MTADSPDEANLAAEPAPASPRGRVFDRDRRLLFESVLIIVSVLFGFALSAWGERRAERRTARAAVENFRVEIEANLSTLERVQPKHARFAEQLATVAAGPIDPQQTAFDVFARNMPEGGLDTPPMREAAWEVALSTGALSLIDYDLAAVLSETYLIQRATLGPTLMLLRERLLSSGTFRVEERDAVLRVQQMMINELAGQETYLIEVYRNALARLAEEGR